MSGIGDENRAGLRGRLSVRPAHRSDGKALTQLLTQLHPTYPPDLAVVEDFIDAVLREPRRTLLVAAIDDVRTGRSGLSSYGDGFEPTGHNDESH